MSTSPGQRMKIGDFLLRRLEEVGVGHLFGVLAEQDFGPRGPEHEPGAQIPLRTEMPVGAG